MVAVSCIADQTGKCSYLQEHEEILHIFNRCKKSFFASTVQRIYSIIKKSKQEEQNMMKKTIDLLNEVVAMGFSREEALRQLTQRLIMKWH